MTCKDLIGYQLVSINSEKIIVQKNNRRYVLSITEDEGYCCGYNDFDTTLLISETELANNPIITNVEIDQDEIDDGSKAKLTFFGEYKPIAVVDSYSSSGSGSCYGACVTIKCEMLGIADTLSSW